MTWFHIYELLRAQDRFFPNADIRPFAPLPIGWPAIEAMFRYEEAKSRPVIEAAIDQFIQIGSWPDDLTERERVWIRGRINFGSGVVLRLSIPISEETGLFPKPNHISDDEIFIWLLIHQWEAIGFSEWLLALSLLFLRVHKKKKKSFDSLQLPPHILPDTPPPWQSNN